MLLEKLEQINGCLSESEKRGGILKLVFSLGRQSNACVTHKGVYRELKSTRKLPVSEVSGPLTVTFKPKSLASVLAES